MRVPDGCETDRQGHRVACARVVREGPGEGIEAGAVTDPRLLLGDMPPHERAALESEKYVHCVTERQARQVQEALTERLAGLGLQLHPDKTKIVYCKDSKRRGNYEHTSFTFLGYTFQPRAALGRNGDRFIGFSPAVSADALAKMSAEVRRWRLHLKTGHDLDGLAAWINPIVAGWMNYYGRFYRSQLYPLLQRINTY
jgi:RNA-directed DNA polymerase